MVAPESKNGIIAYRFQAVCGMARAFTSDDKNAHCKLLRNYYENVTKGKFLTSRTNPAIKLPEIRY